MIRVAVIILGFYYKRRAIIKASEITNDMVEAFRRDGVVKVPGVLSQEEVAEFRSAAMDILNIMDERGEGSGDRPFYQKVNVWRECEVMKRLSMHPNVAASAKKLSGTSVRLWHDHILAKKPGLEVPTSYHQDLVKWPFPRTTNSLSAWIALQDTPAEMGCMTFIPETQRLLELENIGTADEKGWLTEMPELEWKPKSCIPLQAGDCTFHHGMTFHAAGKNSTDLWRVAHITIYVDSDVEYTGVGHMVTDPLKLDVGSGLPDDMFPVLGEEQ